VSAPLRFWGSAVLVALVFAALVPVLFPFRALGMDPAVERERVWMVVVFYTGVLAVLFGLGALISGPRLVSTRDIAEAGSVGRAVDRARRARRSPQERRRAWANFATWLVACGGSLVLCYFALWAALGRG
jgi:hypothetical protein